MQEQPTQPTYRRLIAVSSMPHLDADPTDMDESEVTANLAAYLALWHPALLALTENVPEWAASYDLYDNLEQALLLVPPQVSDTADPEWESRVVGMGATVISAGRTLNENFAILSQALGQPVEDSEETRTFLAIGLGRLWWTIVTTYLGREQGIDLEAFRDAMLTAARSEGPTERQNHLDRALGLLQAARDRVYPVELYTLSFVYLGSPPDETAIAPLLDDSLPLNLVLTGRTVEQLEADAPSLAGRIRSLVEANRLDVVGGEWVETRHPLLPINTLLYSLARGMQAYQQHLGTRPEAYGRRSFGLAGYLPQILNRVNVYYALHFSMDGASFPEHYEPRIRWEGLATSSVQALTRVPYNLSDPRDVLAYGRAVAQTIASDHVATTAWAYDPADPAIYVDLVARLARLTPAFGRWYTLTQYFQTTEPVDTSVHPSDDEYRSVYLLRDHVREHHAPVSRYQAAWRQHGQLFAAHVLDTIARTLRRFEPPVEVEESVYLQNGSDAGNQLARMLHSRAEAVSRVLVRPQSDAPPDTLILNPAPEAAAVAIPDTLEGLTPVRPLGQPFAVNPAERTKEPEYTSVVEVPPFGYTVASTGGSRAPVALNETDDTIELRTGELSATIDRQTGALKGFGRTADRLPRVGVRLCARGIMAESSPGTTEPYVAGPTITTSRMAAYRIHVLHAGPAFGEVVTEGILVGDPPPATSPSGLITRFRISYQVTAGTDVLRMACELWDLQEQVFSDESPWNQHIGLTLAWPDPATAIVRGTGALRSPTRKQRFEAPAFIELHDPPRCTAVLTGGLPFYVRTHARMADLILVTATEKCRFFEIALALDPHNPYHTLATLLSPPLMVPVGPAVPRGPASGWFFHVDAQNIAVLDMRSLDEEGKHIRLRLLETAGQSTRVRISSWKPIQAACMTDFLGEVLFQADTGEDYVDVDVLAHELVQLELQLK